MHARIPLKLAFMEINRMDIRLLLISHASTAAMRAARFPADDPLDAPGLADASAARARLSIPDNAATLVSPAVCARDTASALGLDAIVHEGLADMDYGVWHGRRLADLAVEAPLELAAWTHDPDAAAHPGARAVPLTDTTRTLSKTHALVQPVAGASATATCTAGGNRASRRRFSSACHISSSARFSRRRVSGSSDFTLPVKSTAALSSAGT